MKILPYIAAMATVLLWSSSFPAVRYTLQYFSPEALMLFRFLAASALLLAYCAVKKVRPPALKDFPIFILSGLIGIFIYMWTFNTGTAYVTSAISSFIISSVPVFTLILSILFLKEKAGALIWIGVLVSFGGIVIIAATEMTEMRLNIGIWLLLAASVSASVYTIMLKHILKKYTPMQATAYVVVLGTVFMLIFMPDLIAEIPAAPMSANVVVIYLGLFPAALAYWLWGYALSAAGKTIYVTSFLYLSPFIAAVMAFFWLGETVTALAFLGGIVVVLGMVITNIVRK